MLRLLLIITMTISLLSVGCQRRDREVDYERPLADGEVALVEVPAEQWPQFQLGTNRAALLTGVEHSLTWLGAKSSHDDFPIAGITHDQVRRGLERFRELLKSGANEATVNQALRQEFKLYASVGYNGEGVVLFTGYYTPIFDGSLQRTARFRYPLYKRPNDLVTSGDTHAMAQQRLPDGSTRPYPARANIKTSGQLVGSELVWLEDPFDCYIVQVQGSGKIRLPDGRLYEVGFNGTNGHPYVSVAKLLVADGQLAARDLNLTNLRRWFRENPQQFDYYVNQNPRYIFFTETKGGPFGSLGRPVTTDVSIATDKRIFPPGALTYVITAEGMGNTTREVAGFRLDQDTGGAIGAPGRCDLYMGEGLAAERRAGTQQHEGRLLYLVAR